MIRIATMESVNPVVILAAMLWNAVYWLVCRLVTGIETGAVGLLGFIRRHGRIALVALGMIGAVVLTAVFWVIVVKLAVGALSIALFAIATKRF